MTPTPISSGKQGAGRAGEQLTVSQKPKRKPQRRPSLSARVLRHALPVSMAYDNEESMPSNTGGGDTQDAGTLTLADEMRPTPATQTRQQPNRKKKMRRDLDDGDDINSYLAGDLAVGVRSREADEHDQDQDHDDDYDAEPSAAPVTSIRQPTSGLSLRTNSSLSTSATASSATAGHNNGSVTRHGSGVGDGAGNASVSSMTPNNSVASPHAAHTPVAGNNNAENTPPPPPTATAQLQQTSMARSSSGAAGSLVTAQSAVTADSWGFFDDHDPTIDTPGNASAGDLRRKGSGQAAATPGGENSGNARSASTPGGGSGGPKRRGLLNFGDGMAEPLQGIPLLDPPKAEPNPDAVTAPTYVLEESRSSQNLWKHTAGNRPPQPAEERAFYEQIWAENFSMSQVAYEMPPEVLMSATPESLSAFADGRDDGGAGVSADYAALGHEGVMGASSGGGGALASKTLGGIGGASSIGPSRVLGAAGAAQHYNLAKTGDTSLGPHHHEKDGDLRIVCKGDNVFGTTVSKSFETTSGSGSKRRTESVSVSISVASYRVVECQKEKGKQYAQFLVIYCEGSFRDVSTSTMTFWWCFLGGDIYNKGSCQLYLVRTYL